MLFETIGERATLEGMRPRLFRDAAATTAVALAALALAGCTNAGIDAPTHGLDAPVRVATPYMAMVLDDGTAAKLCLGAIMESFPPQCSGPTLIGWDWNATPSEYEEASGVRWGDYWVGGVYNAHADTFTVEKVERSHHGPDFAYTEYFGTHCEEPEGGWEVADESRTTTAALKDVMAYAATMDGHAGSWIDRSRTQGDFDFDLGDGSSENPSSEPGEDPGGPDQPEFSAADPALVIVNVRTTGDVAHIESALRERWGGMLCVTAAAHTEAQLLRIQDGLTGHNVLSTWVDVTRGSVHAEVLFDDGTLQQNLDTKHGVGVVKVRSALTPWPGA